MTLGYASRRIADVISCVFNGSTDRPYIGTPFDSDLAGLQVHNGTSTAGTVSTALVTVWAQ